MKLPIKASIFNPRSYHLIHGVDESSARLLIREVTGYMINPYSNKVISRLPPNIE